VGDIPDWRSWAAELGLGAAANQRGMKMAPAADEFKEEMQRIAHFTEMRNDERIQASDRALRLFGPIRNFLSRFNEALGAFGKIELSEGGVSYQRSPYQLSEYSRLESQLKSDVVAFLEKG
jgi:hypothetical protein